MIKVEDLRIGDLVRYGQQVYTIQAVNANGIVHFAELDLPVECSLLEPIQITTEILEKNGWKFKKMGFEDYYYKVLSCILDLFVESNERGVLSVGYFITIYDTYFKSSHVRMEYCTNNINYIHELQHVLWAFGMDANFKI